MPAIPDSVLDDIRARTDIVELIESYVPLKRRGADYWGCCPFHHEKTPSFKVSPQHQAYYCFGCKKSGSAFQFVMERENVDFVGAVRLLAQRCGVEIPEAGEAAGGGQRREARQLKDRLFDLLKAVAAWYQQLLLNDPAAAAARDYLAGRGIPEAAVRSFGIGYAPAGWEDTLAWGGRLGFAPELLLAAGLVIPREGRAGHYDRFRGRLMFPICDEIGRCVGFSGRVLEADAKAAKYVNSPETELFKKGKLLYGLHLARVGFKEQGFALVCEGQLDVIACHRAGMTNAVAPQGTAFTEQHAALLKRFTEEVAFCFDADPAGEKATLAALEVALAAGLRTKVVTLPGEAGKEDPDSLFRKRGGEALAAILKGGCDALEHVVALGRRRFDAASPAGRSQIVELALPILAKVPNPVLRAGYAQWLAQALALPEDAVLGLLTQEANREHRQQLGRQAATGRAAPQAPASPAAPAPGRGRPEPRLADVAAKCQAMLLDIALRDEAAARHLAAALPHDLLADTPTGRALNTVLALAMEGEWAGAGQLLMQEPELAADPAVGRAVLSTDFVPPPGAELGGDEFRFYQQRVRRAMGDCLARLEGEQLTHRLAALKTRLATEPDPEAQAELSREFAELTRRRDALRGGRGGSGRGGVSA
ncbi:MAG: DNA primase [Lentisphaeria bacterium]|jgi:DNA primase